MKLAAKLVGLALAHAILTVALLVSSFGAGMSRFRKGVEGPSALESAVSWSFNVLSWPVLSSMSSVASSKTFPGLWGYVPILANSLLWSIAIMSIAHFVRRK